LISARNLALQVRNALLGCRELGCKSISITGTAFQGCHFLVFGSQLTFQVSEALFALCQFRGKAVTVSDAIFERSGFLILDGELPFQVGEAMFGLRKLGDSRSRSPTLAFKAASS
jgi:hypothetical protein